MNMKSVRIIFLLLIMGALNLQAQTTSSQSPLEIGLLVGAAAYGGDLRSNDAIFLDQPGFSLGVGLRYPLSTKLSVSANVIYARLRADDANDTPQRQRRDYAFTSNVFEFSLRGEWHPLAKKMQEEVLVQYPVWSPYLFGGVGLAAFNANPDFRGDSETPGVAADKNQNENSTLVIPFGLGLRLELNETTSLGVEYGFRASRSDYFDGISQSANPDKNDHFSVASLQVWKRFGGQ